MSNNSNAILNQIKEIVGQGPFGGKIKKYIYNNLTEISLSKKEIDDIIDPIFLPILIKCIGKNKSKKYLTQLLFMLEQNIPLGKTFSFFDKSITENKILEGRVVMPKEMSRTWNIFNDRKFALLRDKLYYILDYDVHENHENSKLTPILEKDKFDQYTYSFDFGKKNINLKELIRALIYSENIVEREMLIYNFIEKYGVKNPHRPSFYENSNRVSYETIGRGNNRGHGFTYLFEKLYGIINTKIWGDSMKEYKATILKEIKKIDNDKKKISEIRSIIKNLNKDSNYNSKLKFLKGIQYPIIIKIKNSQLTGKQRKQRKQNIKTFGKNATPPLGNVLKKSRTRTTTTTTTTTKGTKKSKKKSNNNLNKSSSAILNA